LIRNLGRGWRYEHFAHENPETLQAVGKVIGSNDRFPSCAGLPPRSTVDLWAVRAHGVASGNPTAVAA